MKLHRLAGRVGLLCVMAGFLLAGCGGGGSGDASSKVTSQSSSLERNVAPVISAPAESAVVSGVNKLGLDLLNSSSGNAVVAPFSASLSLAKLRAGAVGPTLTAFSTFMEIAGLGSDDLPVFNALDLGISARMSQASLEGQLSQSTAGGWAQARYGYLRSYVDSLAMHFGLKPLFVDFDAALSNATQEVANWATLASGGLNAYVAINKDTRLVVADAVRFNAAWLDPFDPSLTETGWFDTGSNSIQTPFLRKSASLNQTLGDGYRALELPLAGGQQLLIVLPDEGRFAEIQSSLTVVRLNQITAALAPALIDLALPKFTVENSASLGLGSEISRNLADFSGIDGTKDLFVSSTSHRSQFSIAEAGIKAGSVTLLALEDAHPETWTDPLLPGYSSNAGFIMHSGQPYWPQTIPVILGRPFLFAVRDSVSGVYLFMGRVVDPTVVDPAL